jgi:hypothetical protein
VEVSWQVTGIRKDAWAEANRIPVEEDKPGAKRGSYVHPELFGQPEEKGRRPRRPGLGEVGSPRGRGRPRSRILWRDFLSDDMLE